MNSFCSLTFPTSLWRNLWGLSLATFPKSWFSFFTPHTIKPQNQARTQKSPNLALHQQYQDQFRLTSNFSHITLEAFVGIESPSFAKPWFSFFTTNTTKSQNLAKTPKSPNLAMHQPYEHQFLLVPKFPTSLWRHLWGLSPATFRKSWFSFFTPHTTKSQNQAKTPKSPNLALHQPYQDQFLFLPNFSHITLEVFVSISSNHFCKNMIFVFALHTTKSQNLAKTPKSPNLA